MIRIYKTKLYKVNYDNACGYGGGDNNLHGAVYPERLVAL